MKQLLLLVMFMVSGSVAHAQGPRVCFDRTCVAVQVVSSDADMTRGLSGHAPLKANEGMLFVFKQEGLYSFWMIDMNFNLDIIWIDKEGKVVDIKENLPPCKSDCPQYTSKDPAQYVLEVPAGYTKKHHIKSSVPPTVTRIIF